MAEITMTYDGYTHPNIQVLHGLKRGAWAPVNRGILTVPGRPGGYLARTETGVREIEVPIILRGVDTADLQKLKEELAEWLVQESPKALTFSDEADRTYFAAIDGELDLDEIIAHGKGKLKFVCPDPYKYGEEQTEQWPILDTLKQDFTGKVSGNTSGNPHIAKQNSDSSLKTPGSFTFEGQWNYDQMKTLNGVTNNQTTSQNSYIPQNLYSFDLIAAIERQYGPIPVATQAEKVAWLKANINKLTANWHGKGTNKMADPNGKADFAGKVAGSTVENPHTTKHGGGSALLIPSSTSLTESSQLAYDYISSLNGIVSSLPITTNGNMAQRLFSFNLIEYIKRKYGYTPTVQWLNDNISTMRINWHGRGSGPNGNKATIAFHHNTLGWGENANWHTSGSIAKITVTTSAPSVRVDSNGLVHMLAYAEASNGTIASTIETDFVELEVELKPGADKATLRNFSFVSNQWGTGASTTSSTITKVTAGSSNVGSYIDSNGFCAFLAHAEPSNGIAASTIETDYIELLIDVNLTYSPSFVNVEGSADTPPNFVVTLKDPVTYLDIIGESDYMRIGRPVNIDELARPERELILHDTMSTMTGWSDAQSSDIDGGVVSGTMTSDGSKFVATSVGTGTAWHGPAKIKSLGQALTDFHVSFQPILDNDELHKIGRIELYLLDANKAAVGKLAIKDISKGQGGNYAELRVGDNTVNNFLISDYGTNWNTWHNFNGLLELTKKGNKWSAYVCKFIDGDRNNRTSRMFVEWEDKENQFTKSVSYVAVHIGGYGTAIPSQMSIQDLQVFKVNTMSAGQIPYIGYTGDIFEFDHATSAIYRNGDFFMRKDFGSRFFNLKPGANAVVFQPSDAITSVETSWRARYK